MTTGTVRNVERTGKRKVTRLSAIARKVEDVRGIDVDYVQYCPSCRAPQAFCEVKSYDVHDKEWEQVRRFARHWGNGCIAMLVVESGQRIGYKYYFSITDFYMVHVTWCDEIEIQRVLEHARDIHECS